MGPGGEEELTGDERLVLAVMALQREVNNGGYSQFFTNSSRRFASTIVEYLYRTGCVKTAAITERAIGALGVDVISAESVSHAALNADPGTNKVLDTLDREYYKLNEIEPQLFNFIEAHQNNIQLTKGIKPPFGLKRPKRSNAARLCTYLTFAKLRGGAIEELREPAREIAKQKSIEVTDAEIDAALTLYLFGYSLRADDTATCEVLAHQAFNLMREDTKHCILHEEWVLRLIREARLDLADTSTLYYLEYLDTCDQSARKTQNTIRFWAAVLQEYRAVLHKSVAFFEKAFPEVDLNEPITTARLVQVLSPRISSKPN
ncbi:MAG: DUF4375 domain-containing protein [Candidatus Sulfotelmatobacter sp.]